MLDGFGAANSKPEKHNFDMVNFSSPYPPLTAKYPLTHLVVDHLQRNGVILEVRIIQRIVVLLFVLVGGRNIWHVHFMACFNADASFLNHAIVLDIRVSACFDQCLKCCVIRPLRFLRSEEFNIDNFTFDSFPW